MPASAPRPPMRCICASWARRSSRSNLPLAILAASFSASSTLIVSAARSTRLTTSPMPRIRPATRSGWKASSLSSASPTPANLIGLPVTARIDSAAPPRASPSMRVRITPERSTSAAKPLATLTASWPVRLSTTSRVSVGFDAAATAFISPISWSSTWRRPAVSSITTSKPCSFADWIARLAISTGCWPATIGKRFDVRLAPEHRQLLLRRRTRDVERRHQHLLALALGQALGELRGRRRLARALEADHHDHGGRSDVEVELGSFRPEGLDQRVIDVFDDHLARRDRAQHFLADRFLGDLFDEVARDRKRHVGLEQAQRAPRASPRARRLP